MLTLAIVSTAFFIATWYAIGLVEHL